MGLKCSPDIAQSIMEMVLVSIDDIFMMLVLSPLTGTTMLNCLALYYGLKPQKKKIDAFLHMDHPQNASELCMFIGCVNYYQAMWASHVHILKPFTDHSGLKKHTPIPWTPDMQTAFDKMHVLMAADALAACPDRNKRFHVYTNASYFQLGICIVQEGQPVAYFSCKLLKSQQNYMVIKKEMPYCSHTQRVSK
ncbi:hypothetical protein ACHAW6_006232 [Cyclotella cf. meneghiniana]